MPRIIEKHSVIFQSGILPRKLLNPGTQDHMQTIKKGCEVGMFLLVLGLLTTCLSDTDTQKTKWKTRLKAEDPSPLAMGE